MPRVPNERQECLILSVGYETQYYKDLVWALKRKTISSFPGVSQNVIFAENIDIVFHQNLTGSKVETCSQRHRGTGGSILTGTVCSGVGAPVNDAMVWTEGSAAQ